MIEQLARSVREALNEESHASVMYVDYLGRMLAAQLLRKHSAASSAAPAPAPGALSQEQMDMTTDYMQAHLPDPISLAQIAAVSGLSPSHFARRFKTANGMPPHRYLMQLRVERAKKLLHYDHAIAEVALRCGFAHQEHLTRVFRRLTGLTPALYRRTIRS
jgi:AraC family transcriptional regulator